VPAPDSCTAANRLIDHTILDDVVLRSIVFLPARLIHALTTKLSLDLTDLKILPRGVRTSAVIDVVTPTDSLTLPTWAPVDPLPFKTRAIRYRIVGFSLLAVSGFYILSEAIGSQQATWSTLGRFLAVLVALLLAALVAMGFSENSEAKAESALLLNQIHAALRSDLRYILLLRSFKSKLVSETTYLVRPVVREKFIMVRGDEFPTGKEYTDYERSDENVDDIRLFVSSAVGKLHVVMIDGNAESLSAGPLCILSNDDDWESMFEQLMLSAALVVVIPEGSPSLRKEVESIIDKKTLHKCILLMPPSRVRSTETFTGLKQWYAGMTRRKQWEEFRADFPISLPNYSEDGAILTFFGSSSNANCWPYAKETLIRSLEEHLSEGLPLARSIADLNTRGLLRPTLTELERRRKQLQP
jgi:hypothetical protein